MLSQSSVTNDLQSDIRNLNYLRIDLRSLPALWWEILWITVNDYLQFDEENKLFKEARDWLFLQDYDPVLDGKAKDIVSFHVVTEAMWINKTRFQFELQCIKDRAKEDVRADPRGRKPGFLTESGLRALVERCKTDDEE